MRDDLLTYYERELAFLRRTGAEFAARYPKVAGRLQLEPTKCEDPHVERLLEGFAFLAARVHLRIDDDFPEISEALLNVVYPHYVRPIPSMSLVQFHPDPEQGKQTAGLRIPSGATLFSRAVGGVPARFRTCWDTTLWPLNITGVRWTAPHQLSPPLRSPDAVAALVVQLEALPDTSLKDMKLDSLRFHLHGEPGVVWTLHELLGSRCVEVVVREPGAGATGRSVALPASSVRLAGFDADQGMLPFEKRSFLGYRLLQEYFTFPEKFAFVELGGLEVLREVGFDRKVEIVFLFRSFERAERRAMLETGVRADTLRLGCTPIVNLYRRVAEPVLVTATQHEYPVVADVRRRETAGIFSVDEVVAVTPGDPEARPLDPFYGFRHASSGSRKRAFWYTHRRIAGWRTDGGSEVMLTFVDLSGRPVRPGADTITARVTCHDGQLPGRLSFGDPSGDFELEGGGPFRKIVALVKPTPLLEPPVGKPLLWRLISQLSLNYTALAEEGVDPVRELLRLHNFGDTAAGDRQIGGLTAMRTSPAHALVESDHGVGFARGQRVEVEMDEEAFAGGSAFLLAAVMEAFLGLYAALNSFTQLSIRTRQRRELLHEWPPRAGWKPLL